MGNGNTGNGNRNGKGTRKHLNVTSPPIPQGQSKTGKTGIRGGGGNGGCRYWGKTGLQEDMDGSWYQEKQPGLADSVRYRETLGLTGHHGVTGLGLVPRGLGVRNTMGDTGGGDQGLSSTGAETRTG